MSIIFIEGFDYYASVANVAAAHWSINTTSGATLSAGRFGGQAFLPSQLPKIKAVRERIERSGRDVMLEVDGGINSETAKEAIAAGADVLVAGTAVFEKGGKGRTVYAGNIARLRG